MFHTEKKLICIFLTVCLFISCISFPVFADNSTTSTLSDYLLSKSNSGDTSSTAYLTSVAALGQGGGGFGGSGFGRDDFDTNYTNYVNNLPGSYVDNSGNVSGVDGWVFHHSNGSSVYYRYYGNSFKTITNTSFFPYNSAFSIGNISATSSVSNGVVTINLCNASTSASNNQTCYIGSPLGVAPVSGTKAYLQAFLTYSNGDGSVKTYNGNWVSLDTGGTSCFASSSEAVSRCTAGSPFAFSSYVCNINLSQPANSASTIKFYYMVRIDGATVPPVVNVQDDIIYNNTTRINNTVNNYYSDDDTTNIINVPIFDENTLIFVDPYTGLSFNINDWWYDYVNRKYQLNYMDNDNNSQTSYVTYGDDCIVVESGGNFYQYNYYITDNNNDNPSGGGGIGTDPSTGKSIWDFLTAIVDAISGFIDDLIDKLNLDWLGDIASDIFDFIKNLITTIFNSVFGWLADAISAIIQFFAFIISWFGDLFSAPSSFITQTTSGGLFSFFA